MKTTPISVEQAERRYVALTALRWLPVGVTLPVTVLLALSRGLTLADVGLVFLVHSVLVAVLELPTGGLADVLGRRPVLVASGVLHLLSCLAYATADSLPGFLLGACLLAAGRALDSGPLEAWYVDAVHQADPTADVTRGLARSGVADCLALAAGAVVGGLMPGLLGGAAAGLLRAPYLTGAALNLLSIGAVLLLVTTNGPGRSRASTVTGSAGQDGVLHEQAGQDGAGHTGPRGTVLASMRRGVLAVPRTVRDATALSGRDAALRRVLLLSLVCGYSLSTLELMGPALFAELAGSTTGGSGVFGVVMAVSFLGGATGSALAPRCRRLARGSTRWAVGGLTVLSGLALLAVAGAGTVALAGAGYACFHLGNAAGWPLLRALAHGRVVAAQRATVVSAWSLALQAGAGLSNLVSPRLGGTGRAYAVAGAVAPLAALLAVGLPGEDPRGSPGDPSGAPDGRAPQELSA